MRTRRVYLLETADDEDHVLSVLDQSFRSLTTARGMHIVILEVSSDVDRFVDEIVKDLDHRAELIVKESS